MVMISGEELRSGFGGGEHVHESWYLKPEQAQNIAKLVAGGKNRR